MRYLHFSDHFTQLFDDPIEVKFPQTTVLLLKQEGLYESFPQTTVLLLEQEGLYESCGYSL